MSKPLNWNESNPDAALLERVNPVFQTARMTLFQLAEIGDTDAAALAKNMGLTWDTTQNSAAVTAPPEQVLGGMIMLETRFRAMARLAEESGFTTVDLPCGYTPLAISFARKGLPYYGLDLPVVIREVSDQICALIPPERRGTVRFREVDATNYASLEKALADIDGPVCIMTEGLLMYFTDSEAGTLCDNIRRILEKKGGCWYTSDPEAACQYAFIMKVLVGDRYMEFVRNAARLTGDMADVAVGKNALFISPTDMAEGISVATDFLAAHGLTAERLTVADHMRELRSLSGVRPGQAAAIRSDMKRCAFWKITPRASAAAETLPSSETDAFGIRASMQDGTLSLALSGRLDTITAPNLLAFFRRIKAPDPCRRGRLPRSRIYLFRGSSRHADDAQCLLGRCNASRCQQSRFRDPEADGI